MSVAGLSAGVLVVLGCSAANNLVKAASRRLLLTAGVAGVAGVTEATDVVALAAVTSVAVAVLVATGVAAILVAVDAAVEVVEAAELPAGAPSVWAS